MAMLTFPAAGQEREGYLALPANGSGKGVLVLHAWWGLNDFFKQLCDRLAEQGFVAFAPDLNLGVLAKTVEEANQNLETRDSSAAQATAESALSYFQAHPARQGDKLSAIGFSMGAMFALELDSTYPDAFDRIVMFYGPSEVDFSQSKALFQCHYGELDEWEPIEAARQIKAANAEVYIYPDTQHWFFETDRPEEYDAEAAELAWRRTLDFLLK